VQFAGSLQLKFDQNRLAAELQRSGADPGFAEAGVAVESEGY